MEGRDLPPRQKVHIPRYSEKKREQKEKRKSSIFKAMAVLQNDGTPV